MSDKLFEEYNVETIKLVYYIQGLRHHLMLKQLLCNSKNLRL